MSIHVKLSSTLRNYVQDYEPRAGLELAYAQQQTATELARSLGLPLAEIKFVMINGRYAPMASILRDGDRVAYFPAVGGG